MNRLRKLILLVPLMLLAAVTNSWGLNTVRVLYEGTLSKPADSNYGGQTITATPQLFNDVTTGDIITVTLTSSATEDHWFQICSGTWSGGTPTQMGDAGSIGTTYTSVSRTVSEENVTRIKEEGIIVQAAFNNTETSLNIRVTLSREGVDIFQIPYASGSNLTPQGAFNNNSALLFDSSLFTSTTVPKGSQEGWNPGLWIQCSDASNFKNISFLAFRVVRWDTNKEGGAGWVTVSKNGKNLEAGNYSFENGVRSVRYNSTTKEIWFQFSNDMLDELYTGACLLVVADGSSFTVTDANYDLSDKNTSRSWNYVTGITVSGDNTVNKQSSITLTSNLTYYSDNESLTKLSNVYWSSSDESIATVDQDGKVTGVTAGKVTITAVPWDNRTVSAEHVITVGDLDYTIRYVSSLPDGNGDKNRLYAMKKPNTTDGNTPVIISLHGATNDYYNGRPNFDDYANNAIIIYPRGEKQYIAYFGGKVNSWDATGENSTSVNYNRDIEFFKNILADLTSQGISYNKKRVYITGHSNGGMMAYAAASQAGDVFAAAASVAGFPVNEFHLHHTGVRPVPFLHIHGTNDNVVKLDQSVEGGLPGWHADDSGSGYGGDFYMIERIIDEMVYRNGAKLEPVTATSGNLKTFKYEAETTAREKYNESTGQWDQSENVTPGADFYYYQVTNMGHNPEYNWDGNSGDDVAPAMWEFFKKGNISDTNSFRELPEEADFSDLKFLADWRKVDASYNKGTHGFYVPGEGNKTLLYFNSEGMKEDRWTKNPETGVSSVSWYGNRNVYRSIQFEARDNNGDGVVQGLHRMRIVINGSTKDSYITLRLKKANDDSAAPTFYKRVEAYTNGQDKEVRLNFNAELGFNDYELWIDKTAASDNTTIKLVEFRSGSYTKAELTPEAIYTPAQLEAIKNMNLVRQPKYATHVGIAKSYFAIADDIYAKTKNPYTNSDLLLPSKWGVADSETATISANGGTSTIYFNDIWRIANDESRTTPYTTLTESAYDALSDKEKERAYKDWNTIAFLTGGQNYTVDKTKGINLGQHGRSGMVKYLDDLKWVGASATSFPSKATFIMKVAGTLDITMMCNNTGTTARIINVYYMNDRLGDTPQCLKSYYVEGQHGQGWYDPNGAPIMASLRLQHMGKDGTCTVFFTYEGTDNESVDKYWWRPWSNPQDHDARSYDDVEKGDAASTYVFDKEGNKNSDGKVESDYNTDDFWVQGFLIKRPDLKVTIGRTDENYKNRTTADYDKLPSNYDALYSGSDDEKKSAWLNSRNNNTNLSAYGNGNPYRWLFTESGFDREEISNERDARTYLCQTVNDKVQMDHLLVYSENEISLAHFVGSEGDAHLQFDSPTQFRYNDYKEYEEGIQTAITSEINRDGPGDVFDPIVNDGLKINVTGSGWFKVIARVPTSQKNAKMTIMTSVNGGTEHIKLLRYFKLPNDGKYHEYVAYLKASPAAAMQFNSIEAKRFNAECEQQSIFVVFEAIGDDIATTIPTSNNTSGSWIGDKNGFQVDLKELSWLNDDVPDYVFQRSQYLFHSQTPNEDINGHDADTWLRSRQAVYPKKANGMPDQTQAPILYWQAGGAHKDAAYLKQGETIVDYMGQNSVEGDLKVYKADGTELTTDNALEDGRWAYDPNWPMIAGGTNPKYDEGGVDGSNYSEFGYPLQYESRIREEARTFGGQWDMAPMPTLGLSHFVESNDAGKVSGMTDNPNVDGVYTGATCQIATHYHDASNPAAASPLWQGAHTEMQSPRIFNQSYNESKRPDGTSSIDKFTWIGGTEWVARNKETNTEYDLPVSGPFYRFMPMKNVKITAYVVSGNAEGKIYVLDETGKIVKTNASGKDWYRLGSVTVENGTIDSDGIITPYSGDNSPLTSDNKRAKTVKITISARAGKEYFLTSTGMAIGVATMYFDEIPTSEIAKRSISSSAKAMHAPAGDGSNFLLYGEAKNTGNIESIIDDSESKTVDVKIDRAFTAGTWQSIVLPFTMNEELFEKVFGKGAMALSFEKIEKNIVYLLHHQYNMITAGRPVFIRPTQNVEANYLIEDVTLSTKEVTSDDFIGVDDETYKNRYRFTGTLDPKTADGDCMIRGSLVMAPSDAGMSGKLMYMTKRTPSRALRSWIEPATEAPEAAAAKLMYAAFDYTGNLIESEELTGIESILNDYFDNENAFVIHEYDKVYDLNGRAVATGEGMDALPSGVYIVNGKKFVK